MAESTAIEWTDATWNPVTGCSVVSPGCTNCYAMKLSGTRLQNHPSRAGLTINTKAGPVWTGEVRFNEAWLDQPLRWRRRRRIFVCAHGDLFHESVPDEWIDRVFAVMALAMGHQFQVLTKRPERMRAYLTAPDVAERIGAEQARIDPKATCYERVDLDAIWPLSHVWLGVSVEDQARADARIPDLLATPAAVRFLSCEPLLGPVDLEWALSHPLDIAEGFLRRGQFSPGLETLRRIDWVICGGESGDGARPMHPDWARSLRDRCAAAGVPFFFKQWGAWLPGQNDPHPYMKEPHRDEPRSVAHWQDGSWGSQKPPQPASRNYVTWEEDGTPHFGERTGGNYFPVHRWAARLGKKKAGRELDGLDHSEFPKSESAA